MDDFHLICFCVCLYADISWIHRNGGSDHVLVGSHFQLYYSWSTTELRTFPALHACNRISFERNDMSRNQIYIASTYVGFPCEPSEKKFDIAFIGNLNHKPPRYTAKGAERHHFCEWLSDQESFGVHDDERISVSQCGQGERCPSLSEARFGIHARGDTFGSNRLIDILGSSTVPIFTHPEQLEIVPPFLPWKKMSVLVDVGLNKSWEPTISGAKFLSSIREILNGDVYNRVQEFNQLHNIPRLLDWERGPYLAELFMAAFQTFIFENDAIDVQYSGNYTRIHGCLAKDLRCTPVNFKFIPNL